MSFILKILKYLSYLFIRAETRFQSFEPLFQMNCSYRCDQLSFDDFKCFLARYIYTILLHVWLSKKNSKNSEYCLEYCLFWFTATQLSRKICWFWQKKIALFVNYWTTNQTKYEKNQRRMEWKCVKICGYCLLGCAYWIRFLV